MNKIKISILFFLLMCLSPLIFPYETIDVQITEVPYVPPYAFLGINFEPSSVAAAKSSTQLSVPAPVTAFELSIMSARPQDLQFEAALGYRTIDISELGTTDEDGAAIRSIGSFDILLGGRLYPKYPTFSLSKMPVRLTFSALGGLSMMNGNTVLLTKISIGFSISSRDNPSGGLIEMVYRPGFSFEYPKTLFTTDIIKIASYTGLQVGFLFGPR